MRQRNARPVGGSAPQRAEMRAEQIELHDHRVLGMVQRDQLVALVWKRGAALVEVAQHLLLPVVYVAGGDQLVARMLERRHRRVEVVPVLRLHVLAHERFAALPAGRRSPSLVLGSATQALLAHGRCTPRVQHGLGMALALHAGPRKAARMGRHRDRPARETRCGAPATRADRCRCAVRDRSRARTASRRDARQQRQGLPGSRLAVRTHERRDHGRDRPERLLRRRGAAAGAAATSRPTRRPGGQPRRLPPCSPPSTGSSASLDYPATRSPALLSRDREETVVLAAFASEADATTAVSHVRADIARPQASTSSQGSRCATAGSP